MIPTLTRKQKYRMIFPGLTIATLTVIILAASLVVWPNRYSIEGWYYCRQLRRSPDWEDASAWVAKLFREPGRDTKLSLAFQAVSEGDEELAFWLLGAPSLGFRHIADDHSFEEVYVRYLLEAMIASPDLARRYEVIGTRISGASQNFLTSVDHWETTADKDVSNEDLWALAIRFAVTDRDDLLPSLDAANAVEREILWFQWFEENRPYLTWNTSLIRFIIDQDAKHAGLAVLPERQVIPIGHTATGKEPGADLGSGLDF